MGLNVYGGLVHPWISVIPDPDGSDWNIYPVPTKEYPDATTQFMFGVVDGINYLSSRVTVGQRVFFNTNQAVLVTQAEVLYYIVDEGNAASFQEYPSVMP